MTAPVRPAAISLTLSEDDLRRSRLTTFFRPLLVIPHFVVLYVLGVIAAVLLLIGWVCALLIGRLPGWAHSYLSTYVKYGAQVNAYMYLAVDAFPPFFSTADWVLTIAVPPPTKQRRWGIFFRFLLAYPVLLLVAGLGFAMFGAWIAAWWSIMILGRIPRGVRNFILYAQGVGTHVNAYVYLLTSQYPVIDPYRGTNGLDQPAVTADPRAVLAGGAAPHELSVDNG